jgi:4-amino-4-deoxy-L-arabinose transferase-like glycosyltransferase
MIKATGVGRQSPPHLVLFTLGITAGFLALELVSLYAGNRDYDEGVYWQSLRAMGRGEPLFTSVFATEPPAFYYTLLPFYLLGHSIEAIRLGVLVVATAGVAAAYLAGRFLAGPAAGAIALVLVATAPFYLQQAAVLQADGPGIALALLAVALALGAVRSAGRRQLLLVTLSGVTLSIAMGTKLSGILAAVPILVALLGGRRRPLAMFVAFAAGALAGGVVILLPMLGALPTAYQELVHSHLGAGQSLNRPLEANLRYLVFARELPLEAAAAFGAIVGLVRRDSRIVLPLAWTLATLAAIVVYQPLFPHHLVQLVPPLALLAAVGVANGPSWPLAGRLAVGVLVALVGGAGFWVGARDTANSLKAGAHEVALASVLRQQTAPQDYLISDNQFAVALADRDIPGPAVDTSRQLMATGLLTIDDIDAAAQQYDVRFVLVDGDRLQSLAGFTPWLAEKYTLVERLGDHTALYRRSP